MRHFFLTPIRPVIIKITRPLKYTFKVIPCQYTTAPVGLKVCVQIGSGPALSPAEQRLLGDGLREAAEALMESEQLLNRLDSGCGDGDCGITLKNFGKGKAFIHIFNQYLY